MIAPAREHGRKVGASGVIVILCVALTLSVVGIRYVKALSQLGDTASTNSSLSFDDRELAGGNSVVVDQRAAYEARALIPVNSSYRIAVGPGLRGATKLTEEHIGGWLRYFLMPRRPDGDDARWVICYGCDPSTLGNRYEVRWRDSNGISIGYLP
jgi:hypothetical protein